MSKFTCGDIKIEGIDHIHTLLWLTIENEKNKHPEAVFRGTYQKGGFDKLTEMKQDKHVEIKRGNQGTEEILYVGYLDEVNLIHEGLDYDTIEVRLLTKTCFMEHDVKSRSFQDVSMTYADLMRQIVNETKGILIQCNVGESEAIGMPIIQFQETNWDFLKRLASHFQAPLLVDETVENTKISVGCPAGGGMSLEGTKNSLGISPQYYILGENEQNPIKSDFLTTEVKSDNIVGIGSGVSFGGQDYFVCSKELHADGEEFSYTYLLGSSKILNVNKMINEKFIGCAIHGNVLETKNDTLKLKLDLEDDTQSPATSYFYNWTPITGNMMYCMPEKDTQVSLYFGDGEETSGTVIDCVRMNGASNSSFSNPSDKYLTTDYNKMMKMTGDTFEFVTTDQSKQESSMKILNDIAVAFDSLHKLIISGVEISIHGKTVTVNVPVEIVVVQQKENSGDGAGISINCDIDMIAKEILEILTDTKNYPIINDKPIQVDNSEFTKKIIKNALFGILATIAVVAVAAVVVAATAGTGAVLVGAVIGAAAAGLGSTAAMTYSDVKNGTAQGTAQFVGKVTVDAVIGAISGAVGGGLEKAGASVLKRLAAEEAFTLVNDSIDKAIDVNVGGEEMNWGEFAADEVFNMGFTALTFGLTDKGAKDALKETNIGKAFGRGMDSVKNSRVGQAATRAKDAVKDFAPVKWLDDHTKRFFDSNARDQAFDQMDQVNNQRRSLQNYYDDLPNAELNYQNLTDNYHNLLNERRSLPPADRHTMNRQTRQAGRAAYQAGNHLTSVNHHIGDLNTSIGRDLGINPTGRMTSNQINMMNLRNNAAQMANGSLIDASGKTRDSIAGDMGKDAAKQVAKAATDDGPKGNTSIAEEFLTRGAKLSCDCGSHKRRLNLVTDHGSRMDKEEAETLHPFVHAGDISCGEGKNITPFGVCQGKNPPPSPTVTFKKYCEDGGTTDALVQGKQCVPTIVDGWNDVQEDDLLGGENGKVKTYSYLQCAYGGIIKVESSGQEYKGELDS